MIGSSENSGSAEDERTIGAASLLPDWVPPKLPGREEEITTIARNFRGMFNKGTLAGISTILLVLGGPGQGKTAMVRYSLRKLLEIAESRNLNLCGDYENCWMPRSASAILGRVIQNVIGSEAKTRGVSTEELGDMLQKYLIEEDAHLLLALDDINALSVSDLNSFFILQEEYGGESRISLILISRPTEWYMFTELNTRINEIFTIYPYRTDQVTQIITYRARLAFASGELEPGVIDLIADMSYQHQNLRLGIELMARSAEKAKKSLPITTEDIRRVKAQIYPELRTEVIRSMHVHELLSLLAVARRLLSRGFAHVTIDEAFRYYKTTCDEWQEESKGESSFRGYLNTLKSLGVLGIIVSATGRKKRGVRARISLNDLPTKIVIERIEQELTEVLGASFSE